MRKTLLTFVIILFSSSAVLAASAQGRVRMVVVSSNVKPADVKVIKSSIASQLVEIIY